MLTSKKGFTKVELVAVIAVAVILAIGLIIAFVTLNNEASNSVALQEQTNQQLADLANKVNNTNTGITAAEMEAKLTEALAGIDTGVGADEVAAAIKAAIASYKMQDLTASTVQTIVNNAIAKMEIPAGVTAADVEKIVQDAIAAIEFPETPAAGLTEAQVKAIVDTAVEAFKAEIPTGVTKAEMDAAIAAALQNVPSTGVTAAEVMAIVNNAIAGIDTGLSRYEVEQIIYGVLSNWDCDCDCGTTTPPTPDQPDQPADTVEVETFEELQEALETPGVFTIRFKNNISVPQEVVETVTAAEKDVVIDLNGNTFKPANKAAYPNASIFEVAAGSSVVFENGTIVDTEPKVNGGMTFIRVKAGGSLELNNVDIVINVYPEVYWNDTMDRWQTNSAEHHVITLGTGSSAVLNDCNITVVSTEVPNVPSYTRRDFAVVGVFFAKDSENASFTMNGGSFTMQITEPQATTKTDTLYFIKAENTDTDATNKVEINGAEITVGKPMYNGELNSTNYPYIAQTHYDGGYLYSGVESIKINAGTVFSVNGKTYTQNETKTYNTENATKNLIGFIKDDCTVAEIVYSFVCTDKAFGCTKTVEWTLEQVLEAKEYYRTINVSGYDLPLINCPSCKYGGFVLQNP